MSSIGDNYLRKTRLCGDAYTKEPLGVGKRFSHRAHGKPRSFAAGATSLRRAGFTLRPQRGRGRREGYAAALREFLAEAQRRKGKAQRGCPVPKALSRIATAPPAGPLDEGCGFAASVTSLRPLPLCDLCVNPFFLFFRVLFESASPPATLRRPGGSGACGDLPRALTPCVRRYPAAAAHPRSAASPSGASRRRALRSGGCVRG